MTNTKLLLLTCVLQRQLSYVMVMAIDWAIMVVMPYDGNRFSFQRMDDKVKDGLVLSVVWC